LEKQQSWLFGSLRFVNRKQTILVVEDALSDQLFIAEAFLANGVKNPVEVLNNGTEAIAYLQGKGKYADRKRFPYPAFIITDLKMPGGASGFEVLDYLRRTRDTGGPPAVVLTASVDMDDVHKAYMLGAAGYFEKRPGFDSLKELLKKLHDYWMACQLPEMDENGRRVMTNAAGKLGERFLK
jgi:CheY-like chemotaxis protein